MGDWSLVKTLDNEVIRDCDNLPYNTFKEKVRIVKEHIGTGYVEVFDDFIYIEKVEENK